MKMEQTTTKEFLEGLIDEVNSLKVEYDRTKKTLKSLKEHIEVLNKMINRIKVQDKEGNFKNLKEKYPERILLFRCGDFYECYKEDAMKVAETIGLITSLGDFGKYTGFPYFSLDEYLPKLIRAGYKVAICDEIK